MSVDPQFEGFAATAFIYGLSWTYRLCIYSIIAMGVLFWLLESPLRMARSLRMYALQLRADRSGQDIRRCSNCGTVNLADSPFCPTCFLSSTEPVYEGSQAEYVPEGEETIKLALQDD